MRNELDQDQSLLESTRVITSLLRATHLNDSGPTSREDASGLATLLDGTHLEKNMTMLATVLNADRLGVDYNRYSRHTFNSNSASLSTRPLRSEHITSMYLHLSAMQLSPDRRNTPADMRSNPLDDAELYRC